MEQEGNVEPGARQKLGEERRKPHRVSRETNDRHAPEDCPVVYFFPVGKTIKPGLRTEPEKPSQMRPKVLKILEAWHQRIWTPKNSFLAPDESAVQHVANVIEKRRGKDDSEKLVKEQYGPKPADNTCDVYSPSRAAESQRHASQRKAEESGE